jgi:hypothetical protein
LTYVRGVLSAVAAIFLTLLGFEYWLLSGVTGNSKAIGMAAFGAFALEALHSPLFWVLAVSLSVLFFLASRLSSTPLRVLLFWIPVTGVWTIGFGISALFTLLWLHVSRG